MPVVTLKAFQPSTRHRPFSRTCPNFRTCWPSLSQSFNLSTNNRPLFLRRLAFLIILALRLINTLYPTIHLSAPLYQVPATLLNILFFFFVAWNLHLVTEMSGQRRVLGYRFGRAWFDGFLWGMVGVHGLMLGWQLWGWWVCEGGSCRAFSGGEGVLGSVVLLCIFGVAWVCSWEPEEGGLNLV
ncbi:hypothetical protein CC78DRAFT_584620 [Lojkania enalia]|uniref:Uncharacterized protein n=1 Tax=Lojkania enalia TaxID=147567 RepID=A0A9P4MZT2_9PLEO|nr:hypothetical protein CC78DRAFT_584620 [Didymosphaeria enalia]